MLERSKKLQMLREQFHDGEELLLQPRLKNPRKSLSTSDLVRPPKLGSFIAQNSDPCFILEARKYLLNAGSFALSELDTVSENRELSDQIV